MAGGFGEELPFHAAFVLEDELPAAVVVEVDAALARLEKSPRHHEWIEVKHGDQIVHTFVAYPEIKDKALAVIVIHENRGLTEFVLDIAQRWANEGLLAVAPDLLSRLGGTASFESMEAAREGISRLKTPGVMADLEAFSLRLENLLGEGGAAAGGAVQPGAAPSEDL